MMSSDTFIEYARQVASNNLSEYYRADNQHLFKEIPPHAFELVWFAHELGNKKCLFFCNEEGMKNYYTEVTYDVNRHKIYVDTYNKVLNMSYDVS